MFVAIANSLAPVFLVIILGWVLKRQEFLSFQSLQDLSWLVYWVGLPCLLFYKIAEASLVFTEAGDLFLVIIGTTAVGIGLGFLLAKLLGISASSTGTFVQAVFRGNLAFIGLPVIIYAFAGAGESAHRAEAMALLALGPLVVIYNVVSVLALLLSRRRLDGQALRRMPVELVSNPLLMACLAGVLYSAAGWPLPLLVQRSLAAIGQMALPLALICIGGSLVTVQIRGSSLAWSISAALVKAVLMPLIGYAFAQQVGLSPEGTRIALILLACPTATVSYVLVRQLGGNEALASGAILISTLLSVFSLAVILVVT